MVQYERIAIDTSKAVFTVHAVDQQERPVLRTNLRRAQLIPFFKRLPATAIAIEACSSAHHWAHELTALGHQVRLIPPQYVKPYVKRGKNDRNGAVAICEAAGRPGMHFVPVKSVSQRAQGMVLKVRETSIGQRVALVNAVRGHAAEFGIIAGTGSGNIVPLLSAIEQEASIPLEAKEMFVLLGQQIDEIDARIKDVDAKLNAAHKANEISQPLVTIPGVGPIIALTLAVEIDPAMFQSGRHLAAWADLTPKERSTGGKQPAPRLKRHVTIGSGTMPRPLVNEEPMTGAERQARYRAAPPAGAPVVRARRPTDRRSRIQRWNDTIAAAVRTAGRVCRLAGSVAGQPTGRCARRGLAGDW
jgi:transposase